MKTITGANLIADTLAELGVKTIFCITGAGNLAIVDALSRRSEFELVYSHHEQAAVMEAQGYARLSGRMGVALVTTGGGAANALTGVLSGYLDSVPLLILAGNESSFHCENMKQFRAFGVQGFDSKRVMETVTKLAVRLKAEDDIRSLITQTSAYAMESRSGPVFLEIPMDLQRQHYVIKSPTETSFLFSPKSAELSDEHSAHFIQKCCLALLKSSKPIIYFGNGVRAASATESARRLVETYRLPFALSWSAIDLMETTHPLNIGRLGIYGDRATNILLQQCDFFLSIGSRLAIPQVGYDKSDFARHASKWVVDIDPIELGKFSDANWNVQAIDAQRFIQAMESTLQNLSEGIEISEWVNTIQDVWKALPRSDQIGILDQSRNDVVHSVSVIESISRVAADDATIVTDVGAGLLSGHYAIVLKPDQRMFTSQGLGEMGFGLPGAIGAFFANPSRQLICLNTDGAIMFNLQELQLITQYKIPIKLFVFNNNGYAMIRISQDNLFDSNRQGSDLESGISFPNFEKLAITFGLRHVQIHDVNDLDNQIIKVFNSSEPCLIEVMMSSEQKYFPRLATTKLSDGSLVSPPLEDMDPLLPIEDLERLLGYKPVGASYAARGINND